MQRTVESVEQYGVLSPLIARPRPEGGYETVSYTHLFSSVLLHRDFAGSWLALLKPPESWKSRFWNIDFDDSAEKFLKYTLEQYIHKTWFA